MDIFGIIPMNLTYNRLVFFIGLVGELQVYGNLNKKLREDRLSVILFSMELLIGLIILISSYFILEMIKVYIYGN